MSLPPKLSVKVDALKWETFFLSLILLAILYLLKYLRY